MFTGVDFNAIFKVISLKFQDNYNQLIKGKDNFEIFCQVPEWNKTIYDQDVLVGSFEFYNLILIVQQVINVKLQLWLSCKILPPFKDFYISCFVFYESRALVI